MEQMCLFFNKCRQNIYQLRVGHQDDEFLIITLAIAICLIFCFNHTLYLIQSYTQSENLQETFQTTNDVVTPICIATSQVSSMHDAMVLIALQQVFTASGITKGYVLATVHHLTLLLSFEGFIAIVIHYGKLTAWFCNAYTTNLIQSHFCR